MREINKAGWEIVYEHIYEKFKIFQVKKSARINPRTKLPFEFFLIDGFDWVNVLAFTANNEVVMIRQYRHGTEEYTLELPGGCVDPGETNFAMSALRELEEETGYGGGAIEHLGTLAPNPAMMSNHLHLYVAHNVTMIGPQKLDPGEDIEVVLLPLEQVMALARDGKITHALHVAALGMYAFRAQKS